MFNKGDKYIHFTKQGGVNIGEVLWYSEVFVHDHEREIVYKEPYIKTTKGFCLNLDGSDGKVYKISDEFNYFPDLTNLAKQSIKNSNIDEVLKQYYDENKSAT